MKNKIKSVLTIFSVLALISIAVAGIMLVLDLGNGPEITEALKKVIYILGILVVLSATVTGIIKINK
ncbi:hypothetical protein A2442_03805 [Candidatus Campbellbacteria bacterium RIFOXYC2_FULL_35_25]|uniref:Uncharacterized protein n=1 Tax=Candidatus Campbellbacteria bacterium RIFOXYC2_FULL_35_25 TaxID=1797582 RepID=A0A1F5EJR2_9BACT|nr:MAG: hypothetical protein A2442_03805 [Candidatus Campbellbacteria bacterium RIFOXYC2_FULL_35_25]